MYWSIRASTSRRGPRDALRMNRPTVAHRFLWWNVSPLTARRIANFRANKRGYWSMWIFLVLFVLSLGAEFIANDRPIAVWYVGGLYLPSVKRYTEKTFGGDFESEADYTDL